jgi:hypothetical protein
MGVEMRVEVARGMGRERRRRAAREVRRFWRSSGAGMERARRRRRAIQAPRLRRERRRMPRSQRVTARGGRRGVRR